MSFTANIKNEISHLEVSKIEKISELSAILHNTKLEDNLKITTENAAFARRIFNLVKDLFHINSRITVRKNYNFSKGYIYILEINSKKDMIIKELGLTSEEIPESFIVSDIESVKAYLRGLFLSSGSVNDPKTSRYHLEILVQNKNYANFVLELMNQFDLNAKVLLRDNKYMIYVKEAEKISDFLRVIGAVGAVLYFEDVRIYRDHKNMTNRLNNCEQANVDKIIMTAMEQIEDIELIESINGLDLLDEKVKEVAIYRKKYSDVSLTELSEIITFETGNPISKSGVHHRMKKIKDLALKIRNKETAN